MFKLGCIKGRQVDLEQIWGCLPELIWNFVPKSHTMPLLFSLPWNLRLTTRHSFQTESNRLNVGVRDTLESEESSERQNPCDKILKEDSHFKSTLYLHS